MKKLRSDSGQSDAAVVFGSFLVVILIVAAFFMFPAYFRYQKRQNAQNEVRVNEIRIQTYQQKVKIAEQEAFIRVKRAAGIRKAQDEISATLTPLYVQFEMVHALESIARSGHNNSVVFIPSGEGGIPLVNDAAEIMRQATDARSRE